MEITGTNPISSDARSFGTSRGEGEAGAGALPPGGAPQLPADPLILPNSLTRTPRVDLNMSGRGGNWFFLYCANCGKDGGRVRETELPKEFAFYLCDPCAEKWGPIAGLYMEPDSVFWKKVNDAMLEKYGRILEPFEIVEALKDEHHILTKLTRERGK